MKKILFLLVPLFLSLAFTQQEKRTPFLQSKINVAGNNEELLVWVFFTDKGTATQQYLANPTTIVSERSLQRRAKVLPKNALLDMSDVPVSREYVLAVQQLGLRLNQQSKWFNGVSGYVKKSAIANIEQLPFVKQLDIVNRFKKQKEDIEFHSSALPVSTQVQKGIHSFNYGSSLTQLQQINVPAVHDLGYTGQGVWIGMMDAGWSNLPHEAFANMTIHAKYDFVNHDYGVGDSTDMGEGSHGTQTLSTIGGFKEGHLIGPAFSATFVLAKTENTDTETPVEEDNWIAAAEWADSIGVDVTSCSLGYLTFDAPYTSYTWQDMNGDICRITIGADMLAAKGVVVVNSAGNSGDGGGQNTLGAPADGDSVISIGALNSDGTRSSFSSVGPTIDGRFKPDVMAMGSGVTVASPTSVTGYTSSSGTSFSCPLSAGVAALILCANPTLTPMQVRDAMRNTASNSGNPNNSIGWGTLNTLNAVNYFRVQIAHTPLMDTENPDRVNKVSAIMTSHLALDESQMFLYYSVNSTTQFDSVAFTHVSDSTYEATIPNGGNNVTIRYYIKAANTASVYSSLPQNAPGEYFQFHVGTDVIPPVISHNGVGNQSIYTWPPKVSATVTDNSGVKTVTVQYKHNNVQQSDFMLERVEGTDRFEARFTLADSLIALGDTITYKVIATDSAATPNVTTLPANGEFSFAIVSLINYSTNFEAANGSLTGDNDWMWGTSTAPAPNPNSGSKLWGTTLNGSYTSGPLLSSLQMPQLQVLDANATLSFYHWYNIETRYDGGNVKMSVNGGAFSVITPVQNYDTTISTQYNNPLGGERGFTGNSNGWKVATFNLAGLVNQGDNVVFSFQFGVDGSVENVGWFIDDVTGDGLGWIPLGVNEHLQNVPKTYSLFQNYPNPFNPTTVIGYQLPVNSLVTLKVYNVLGQEMGTLINSERMDAGSHFIEFNADKFHLTSGIYLYRITAGNFTETKKLVLVK